MKALLNRRHAPATDAWGFLAADLGRATGFFTSCLGEIRKLRPEPFEGTLDQALTRLGTRNQLRVLLAETQSERISVFTDRKDAFQSEVAHPSSAITLPRPPRDVYRNHIRPENQNSVSLERSLSKPWQTIQLTFLIPSEWFRPGTTTTGGLLTRMAQCFRSNRLKDTERSAFAIALRQKCSRHTLALSVLISSMRSSMAHDLSSSQSEALASRRR